MLFSALAATLTGAAALYYFAHKPLRVAQLPVEFELKSGSTLRTAARQLVEAGVLKEPWRFIALTRLLGKQGAIKAGSYELSTPLSPLDLLEKITSGDVIKEQITFVEGWTFRQWRQVLNEHQRVRHDSNGLTDAGLLDRVGATGYANAEGLFLPETYLFSRGASDVDILRRAHEAMNSQLARLWVQRPPELPFTKPYDALILASIVEKETGVAAERPLIAAVLVNRLRRGMKLQADPTVIYGMGEAFDGNLRKADLLLDTPYNTYTRVGLPPTPISMPGLASLQATVHPPATDALYYVAKGDGSSHFSATLEEHNRAVNRYQRGGRSR